MAGPRTSASATLALALDPFAKRVWVVKSSQAPKKGHIFFCSKALSAQPSRRRKDHLRLASLLFVSSSPLLLLRARAYSTPFPSSTKPIAVGVGRGRGPWAWAARVSYGQRRARVVVRAVTAFSFFFANLNIWVAGD
jgi:hypothetical protein